MVPVAILTVGSNALMSSRSTVKFSKPFAFNRSLMMLRLKSVGSWKTLKTWVILRGAPTYSVMKLIVFFG